MMSFDLIPYGDTMTAVEPIPLPRGWTKTVVHALPMRQLRLAGFESKPRLIIAV